MKLMLYNHYGVSKVPGCEIGASLLTKHCIEKGINVNELEKQLTKDDFDKLFSDDINCIIGADHSSTSTFITNNFRNKFDTLIIFDAHNDFDCNNTTNEFTNWNVINNIYNFFETIIMVGNRHYNSNMIENENIKYIKCYDLYDADIVNNNIINEIKNKQVYISVDLDVLDPLVFKGTYHRLPAGLNINHLLYLLKVVLINANKIIVDIVEFNPIVESQESLDILLYIIREIFNIEKSRWCIEKD